MENFFSEGYIELKKNIYSKNVVNIEVDRIISLMGITKNDLILDHCCGDGRHLQILQEKGYISHGIDNSEYMVNLGRKKGLNNLFLQDVKNPLNYKYDKIYNVYTSFGYGSDEDIIKIIDNIFLSLNNKGLLLIDVVNGNNINQLTMNKQIISGNFSIENKFKENNRIEYEIKNLSNNISNIIDFKYFFLEELIKIFEDRGFKLLNFYGNLQGVPFNDNSKHITCIFIKK